MSMPTRLSEQLFVSPQVMPTDLERLKALGFKTLVNNRPDGEQSGQPTSRQIGDAACAAGLGYVHVPISTKGFGAGDIEAFGEALTSSDGPVLAFCRSGMRSAMLWALSQAGRMEAHHILAATAAAGFNLANLLPHLTTTPGAEAV